MTLTDTYLNINGNIQENGTSLSNKYLQLTGGTISNNLTVSKNIDCGGGLALTGSNAFFSTTSIDAGNIANTYINFKGAGAGSDWCYLRQIGGNNAYKLAFDFHDDVDARFCLRSINSVINPDTIVESFTVDNGIVSCTGAINANGNSLVFPNTLADLKITLWNGFGFGVQPLELKYTSFANHKFYTGSTNTFTIDNVGNISNIGTITQINPSNVSLKGFTTLSSNLTVLGTTTLGNNITQTNLSNVSLTGFTILSSNLTVSGDINFQIQ